MLPKNTLYFKNLAEMKYDNENFNEALYLYQRALKIIIDEKSSYESSADVLHKIAYTYVKLGNNEKAVDALNATIVEIDKEINKHEKDLPSSTIKDTVQYLIDNLQSRKAVVMDEIRRLREIDG